MTTGVNPIEGSWYECLDDERRFAVVTVDEDEGIIEIQHYDGDVEEIDFEEWEELDLEAIDQPEDWLGTLGEVDDDMNYEVGSMEDDKWGEPISIDDD